MQNVAFILIGVGILILIGWGVKGFFMASDIPLLIRVAVGVIGIGTRSGIRIRKHFSNGRMTKGWRSHSTCIRIGSMPRIHTTRPS